MSIIKVSWLQIGSNCNLAINRWSGDGPQGKKLDKQLKPELLILFLYYVQHRRRENILIFNLTFKIRQVQASPCSSSAFTKAGTMPNATTNISGNTPIPLAPLHPSR